MVSKEFAMRYACRQKGCGLVPKSEAGWIIATQKAEAKEYWFRGACGGEFKYGSGAGDPDSRGQDKDYQHSIFMQVPWGDGATKTMCAMAKPPSNEQACSCLC